MFKDFIGVNGVGVKSKSYNHGQYGIPEKAHLVQVHIIIFLFIVLDLHYPELVVKKDKDANNNTSHGAHLHVVVPLADKSGFFHKGFGLDALKLTDSFDSSKIQPNKFQKKSCFQAGLY